MSRVAILIDGDNVSHKHAEKIAALGRSAGEVQVSRAYADVNRSLGWDTVPGVNLIHSGGVKNGSDLLLSIDAVELALTGACDTFFIASSDRDFTHVATRLRERGFAVVGVGETKAHNQFRESCTRFVNLDTNQTAPMKPVATKVSELDRNIRTVIAENSTQGMGIRLSDLNVKIHGRFDFKISTHPDKNWRRYLTARPELYDVDPRGPDAHVRFRPEGFCA